MEQIIQITDTKNLSFISTGPIPPNPSEVLSSDKQKQVINYLKERFDVIIIDSASFEVADAVSLSSVVDGYIYVINAGNTTTKQAFESLEQLKKVEATVVGSILNNGYVIKDSND